MHWIRILCAICGSGLCAGGVGIMIVLALWGVEWIAFGRAAEYMMDALRDAPPWRRFLAVPVGAVIAGLGWWWLRRRRKVDSIAEAVAQPNADFPVWRTTADALLQVLVVGAGTSVGRENAPRQMAAALANWLSGALDIDWPWRRLVVASGAGAGLAAVYNTPVAAIPFTLSVILGEWSWRGILVASSVSAIATPLAWLVTKGEPATPLPAATVTDGSIVYGWALAAIPLCAALGVIVDALCEGARRRAVLAEATWRTPVAMGLMGCVTGAVGLALPQVLGNGKSSLDLLFGNTAPIESISIMTFLAVMVIKPVVTAATLRVGVVGGLLMPSAATGGALGALVALALPSVLPASGGQETVALFALIGAAGVLAVTQKSAAFSIVFFIELTHCGVWLWPAVALTGGGACWLSHAWKRWLSRRRD